MSELLIRIRSVLRGFWMQLTLGEFPSGGVTDPVRVSLATTKLSSMLKRYSFITAKRVSMCYFKFFSEMEV